MVNFQVIKVDFLYNMLLERPWLKAIGAVVATLHWSRKFITENQLIIIMAEIAHDYLPIDIYSLN